VGADVNLDTLGLCRRNVRKSPAPLTVVSPEILDLESMTGMSVHVAGNKTAQCIQATLNMEESKANDTCFEVGTWIFIDTVAASTRHFPPFTR